MAFTFEITRVNRLARAHVGVLDGKLLEGTVITGSHAELVHDGQRVPVRVKGVVLDSVGLASNVLSVTVDLREKAMGLATVGDRLVCP